MPRITELVTTLQIQSNNLPPEPVMTEVETEQDQDDMSVEGRKERPDRPSVGLSNISSQGCSRVFVIKSTNSQIHSIFHFYLPFFTNTDIYHTNIYTYTYSTAYYKPIRAREAAAQHIHLRQGYTQQVDRRC